MDPKKPPQPDAEVRWYEAGLRFECTQCGRCCRSNGEYEYLYLTSMDAEALASELGLPLGRFLEQYTHVQDGWVHLDSPGPACRFLDAKGRCSVYEARPMQCRTWPFWRENLEEARWKGPVRAICPGLDQGQLHSPKTIETIAERNEAWYESDGTLGA